MSRFIARNLSVNGRQDSLSSVYSSSMESLSSSHAAPNSCWSIDQALNTSHTISQLRINTSDYDTTSPADYDGDKKHSKKSGRVRKVFFTRSSKLKKATSADKETPPDAAELIARLALLEEQVRTMGEELHKERVQRKELEQKVEDLQSENEVLKSERKVAGDQLQKFCKKFFDSVNSIPPHLMHNGISTSSLSKSALSTRHSKTSIGSVTSQ